jgi:hypothetical protein
MARRRRAARKGSAAKRNKALAGSGTTRVGKPRISPPVNWLVWTFQ